MIDTKNAINCRAKCFSFISEEMKILADVCFESIVKKEDEKRGFQVVKSLNTFPFFIKNSRIYIVDTIFKDYRCLLTFFFFFW